MPEAALSVVAGPVISSLVQDVIGSAGGSNGAGGDLFGNLLKGFTSAFSGLFGSASSMLAPPAPSVYPYSTAQMSPAVYNDPISYTQSAADQYYRGGVTVRDHRHLPATEWLPPKPVIGTDQNALDDAAISNAQGAADQADAFASQNPNNLAAQNDAQRKDLALQNLFARISEKNKEKAQMQHEAIQASVLS